MRYRAPHILPPRSLWPLKGPALLHFMLRAMGVYRSLKLVLHVVVRLAWPPNAFGHLGIGNRFDNNCLLDKAVEEFAAGARCPSVEAKGEFIKVVVKVLSADCALVRSQQPSLDQ